MLLEALDLDNDGMLSVIELYSFAQFSGFAGWGLCGRFALLFGVASSTSASASTLNPCFKYRGVPAGVACRNTLFWRFVARACISITSFEPIPIR